MNKYHNEKEEYIKTILWTFLMAVIVTTVGIIDLGLNTQNPKEDSVQKVQMQNRRLELEKLYYFEKNDKNNYLINLKIAVIHETLKEYNQAEANYEKAITKSGGNPFVLYRSAMFYAAQKKYTRAIELANLFPNTENKKIFIMKTKFYSRLAKSFLEDKDYANSIKTYKIAYKYARNSSKELKEKTAINYANAYSEYADKCIANNEPKLAIQALKNAIEVYPDPLAKYKLGLIYRNVDDEKSQKFIEEAYNLEPNVVNLELYNEILNKLIDSANKRSDYSRARFYTLKLEHLKRKVNEYQIFKGDISITDFKITHKRNFLHLKKNTYAQFNLKNDTKNSINNLYIKITVEPVKGAIFSSEERIVTRSAPLGAQKIIPEIKIKLEPHDNTPDDILHANIQIYARKNIRAPWILIDFRTINIL